MEIRKIDTEWTSNNRAQLWAEAVVAFNNGEKWYLENEAEKELEDQSSDFRQIDPWQEVIEEWLCGRDSISTKEIMKHGLKLESYQMTRHAEMRIGDIMRQMEYERTRKQIGGQRTYVWKKTDNVISIELSDVSKEGR